MPDTGRKHVRAPINRTSRANRSAPSQFQALTRSVLADFEQAWLD
jgi:hypothetical protein